MTKLVPLLLLYLIGCGEKKENKPPFAAEPDISFQMPRDWRLFYNSHTHGYRVGFVCLRKDTVINAYLSFYRNKYQWPDTTADQYIIYMGGIPENATFPDSAHAKGAVKWLLHQSFLKDSLRIVSEQAEMYKPIAK